MLGALLAAALAASLPARTDAEAAVEAVAATVLTLEGQAELEQGGAFKPLSLGQLLGPGDRVRTGKDGGLHLALADGSSVSLGPSSQLSLQSLGGPAGGTLTALRLERGLLNAMVEPLRPGTAFEILSPNAVVAVAGTEFEVRASAQETVVSVHEGSVRLGDADRRRFEPVLPLHRRRLLLNRLLAPERLAKREAGALRERWARARIFHAQRHSLLRHFKGQDHAQRVRWRKELLQRRAER
jgi:ferric-dicitrate binding protein FerR (iron transport regulator)